MSNETTFRKYLATKINGHVSQVESHATSVGIPDTNFCINSVEGWIECKYTVNGKRIKVRGTQKTWFRRRLAAGAKNLFLAIRSETEFGRKQGIIRIKNRKHFDSLISDTSPENWLAECDEMWHGEIDEHKLNEILRG